MQLPLCAPAHTLLLARLQEGFPEFAGDPFPAFENYGVQFPPAPQQSVFPGPPTPPGQPLARPSAHAGQPQSLRPQQQVPASTGIAVPLAPASAMITDPQSTPDILPNAKSEPGLDDLQQQEQSRRGGSNSDDEELTPAQSRRKAQNRAAYVPWTLPPPSTRLPTPGSLGADANNVLYDRQRAFRERKERHVKDLEAKLASLEAAQQKATTENEKLKRDLQKVSTENEILRATSSLQAGAGGSPASDNTGGSATMTTGPMTYNPTDFYTDLLSNHDVKTPSHRIATSDSGERLLGAGATWDYIIGHDSFKRGLIDVADISNRLKSQAKCDGQGPVFEERAILAAIEQSVGSGSDSLL